MEARDMLPLGELAASDNLWNLQVRTLNETLQNANGANLHHHWQAGRMLEEARRDARAFGYRNRDEIAASLGMPVEVLDLCHQFHKEYPEESLEQFVKDGLGFPQVCVLMKIKDPAKRAEMRARLVAKELTWSQAMDQASARQRIEMKKEKEERKKTAWEAFSKRCKEKPLEMQNMIIRAATTRLVDYVRTLMVTRVAYDEFNKRLDEMAPLHRLQVLKEWVAFIEGSRYLSRQLDSIENKIRLILLNAGHQLDYAQPELDKPQPYSGAIWSDLHECPLTTPKRRRGKRFSILARDFRRPMEHMYDIWNEIPRVEWAVNIWKSMPPSPEKILLLRRVYCLCRCYSGVQGWLIRMRQLFQKQQESISEVPMQVLKDFAAD